MIDAAFTVAVFATLGVHCRVRCMGAQASSVRLTA
jgi:hypothetical protein